MEQLSNCLDLSVKKYDDLNNWLKDQSKYSKYVKEVIEQINQTIEKRTWSEIGFFVFAGFIAGLIAGSATITCVFWVSKKRPKKSDTSNTQVILSEMHRQSCAALDRLREGRSSSVTL